MKCMINFTSSEDDVRRYKAANDLKNFYRKYECSGLELMPLEEIDETLITRDMVVGVHLCCLDDWIDNWRGGESASTIPWIRKNDRETIIAHYRKDLEIAKALGAEYVVFHVCQVSFEETLGAAFCHTDEEVADAACELINALMDGQDYDFWFLMENMWYPGLTFLRLEIIKRLLDGIHYEKKGFMFDTGHFMHTNLELKTQREGIDYILEMLDRCNEFIPYIKGIHLQQSLTGEFVKSYMQDPPAIETDPDKLFEQVFSFIFQADQHKPFTDPNVKKIVERINPLYLTYEYISGSREEHAGYLEEGVGACLRR